MTATSGRMAETAVSVSPVKGQVIGFIVGAEPRAPLRVYRPVPLYPRSTANGRPDAPAT